MNQIYFCVFEEVKQIRIQKRWMENDHFLSLSDSHKFNFLNFPCWYSSCRGWVWSEGGGRLVLCCLRAGWDAGLSLQLPGLRCRREEAAVVVVVVTVTLGVGGTLVPGPRAHSSVLNQSVLEQLWRQSDSQREHSENTQRTLELEL